jgi:hypothetical protein
MKVIYAFAAPGLLHFAFTSTECYLYLFVVIAMSFFQIFRFCMFPSTDELLIAQNQ